MTGKMSPSRDIARLIEIMAALRTPVTGCPWDLAQNFASIAPYTLEEAYEVADAIARGDLADLKDELGDLLLQVVYHTRMAEEAGAFQFGDVVEGVTRKMIRRHPHVFGDETARSPSDVDGLWARIKAEERAEKAAARAALAAHVLPSPLEAEVPRSGGGADAVMPAIGLSPAPGTPPITPSEISPTPNPSQQDGGGFSSILADIPIGLPALTRAIKLQDKAAKVGFDWPSLTPVFEKLREELMELEEVALPHDPRGQLPPSSPSATSGQGSDHAILEEFGDLLFVMANVARHLKIDPEAALRAANQKFVRRFNYIEQQLAAKGSAPAQSSLAEMDELWDEAKAKEKKD